LGLIGDEFKTAREHLLKNLDGCIAWRDPAQAEKQKERMRQKKEKELEQARQEAQPTVSEPTEAEAEDAPAFTMRM
jgi:hypothetical protein